MSNSNFIKKKPMASDTQLSIVKAFLFELDAKKIRYCHFKSNEHLDAAVQGNTDLDLLFEESRKEEVVTALNKSGFVRYKAVALREYPGIDDYLGIDSETGKLVHVHAHFRLLAGETGVKSYHFPWEKEFLAKRQWDEGCRIYRSAYSHEMVLLMIRAGLKQTHNDTLRSFLGLKDKGAKTQICREYIWLRERVEKKELADSAKELIGDEVVNPINELYDRGFDKQSLTAFLESGKGYLSHCRRMGRAESIYRKIGVFSLKVFRYFRIFKFPKYRTTEGNGVIIAVLGPDGVGKSTQTRQISKTIARKVDVLSLYMGSGKGRGSLERFPLMVISNCGRRLGKLFRRIFRKEREGVKQARQGFRSRTIGQPYHLAWGLMLALERRKKLRRIAKAKARGFIIVCDRYPQTEIMGYNDGPLLATYRQSKIPGLRQLAEFEKSTYESAQKIAPDIVLKLFCKIEVLAKRRPELDVSRIEMKQEGIRALRYSEKTIVFEIDASKGETEVFVEMMERVGHGIWQKQKA